LAGRYAGLNRSKGYLSIGSESFFESLLSPDRLDHFVADFVPHVIEIEKRPELVITY